MKKRWLALALCAALVQVPALAAGETEFSDVPAGSWFAEGVKTCAERGVMIGTAQGVFSPDAQLSRAECRALAYRLYDIRRGGDGALLPAPEDWGYLTLAVDGHTFGGYTDPNQEGKGSVEWGFRSRDDWAADGSDYPGYSLPAAFLSPEWAGWAWSVQNLPAVMTLNGVEYAGKASYGRIYGDTVQISFLPDGGEETAKLLNDSIYPAPPAPGRWWRDLAYTLESQGLLDMFGGTDYWIYTWEGPADREEFARALARSAGELEPINSVSELPDCTDEEVLGLYRGGILTGTDEYGSFRGNDPLTRAQAAVMAARVLEPGLRVASAPKPLPTEGYTLTYLMDGAPDCGVKFPVCLLGQEDIMLTLDGRQLPWPAEAGVPSYALNPSGDYCFMGFYDESTQDPYDTKGGLIDRNGVYVVPPENGRGMTYAVEGGFFTEIHRESGTVWGLLDEQGRWVRELEQTDGDPRETYPPKGRQPLRGIDFGGSYYVDAAGAPVSRRFDWGSYITDDGQGFVGLDEKIYRIEFE